MTTFFHVKSNLKHNGTDYPTGSFLEGELAPFETLVADGVLEVVEGADSEAEAREIVAKQEADKTQAEADAPEEKQPENTWGPKPDPAPADDEDENKDANVDAPKDEPTRDAPTPPAPADDDKDDL